MCFKAGNTHNDIFFAKTYICYDFDIYSQKQDVSE